MLVLIRREKSIMSATVADPVPHDPALLPLPTAGEVVALQAVRDYPAVSLLCSTEPRPLMSRTDAARLGSLAVDAVNRLHDEFGPVRAQAVRDQLDALSRDAMARPTRAGAVALYVSQHHSSSWALPVRVVDRAVVDPTFATRDLVRALHRTPRHVVLVLTDREARLFDGVGDVLLPALPGPFPIVAARLRRKDRPRRSRGKRRVTEVRDEREAFHRTVDRALGTYLRLRPAPLVLVGASRTLARFTHLSRNLGRLAGTVHGSHVRTPLPMLASLIRPVLETYLRSRQAEALALLEERAGAGRVVTGMPAVWLAARAERPEMLAVEQGLFYPARLSTDGDFLNPATDIEDPEVIDDAVDEVIEIVLRRGGWIALVEDGALASEDRIALSLRRR
jgi:Bacterial archaeo-eukaryotic release factor family 3